MPTPHEFGAGWRSLHYSITICKWHPRNTTLIIIRLLRIRELYNSITQFEFLRTLCKLFCWYIQSHIACRYLSSRATNNRYFSFSDGVLTTGIPLLRWIVGCNTATTKLPQRFTTCILVTSYIGISLALWITLHREQFLVWCRLHNVVRRENQWSEVEFSPKHGQHSVEGEGERKRLKHANLLGISWEKEGKWHRIHQDPGLSCSRLISYIAGVGQGAGLEAIRWQLPIFVDAPWNSTDALELPN